MTTFRRMAKQLNINLGDWNTWMDSILLPKNKDKRKRLFDHYEKSLRKVEIFESDLQTWTMRNWDKPNFTRLLRIKGYQLRNLEKASVERLRAILDAYIEERSKK